MQLSGFSRYQSHIPQVLPRRSRSFKCFHRCATDRGRYRGSLNIAAVDKLISIAYRSLQFTPFTEFWFFQVVQIFWSSKIKVVRTSPGQLWPYTNYFWGIGNCRIYLVHQFAMLYYPFCDMLDVFRGCCLDLHVRKAIICECSATDSSNLKSLPDVSGS